MDVFECGLCDEQNLNGKYKMFQHLAEEHPDELRNMKLSLVAEDT